MTIEIIEKIKPKGDVEAIIDYLDGKREVLNFRNTVLRKGREALAASLANEIDDVYDFYISRMLFGDGGISSGVPKYVNTERNGLFGVTRVNKSVISSIDPNARSKAIFTTVISFTEGNGYALNEMALQMNSGDLYSMLTFPDLNKTEQMQITWNWSLTFV